MNSARLADQINLMPYEEWLRADESAVRIGLSTDEAGKVLRAGRRSGTITVRRDGELLLYKRVRRHPLPQTRLAGARP